MARKNGTSALAEAPVAVTPAAPSPVSGTRVDLSWTASSAPDGLAGHSRVLRVRLAAPPVDGKANDEFIKVLAKAGGVSKSAIAIRQGASGRLKIIEVPENWRIEGE